MADEDPERAEKLAAARKKFEQAKKQKQKESKKAGKRGTDKATADKKPEDDGDAIETADTTNDKVVEAGPEDKPETAEPAEATTTEEQPEPVDATTATEPPASTDDEPSDNFTQELHKQQTTRIEELEQENKSLKEQLTASKTSANTNDEIAHLQARIRDLEAENFDLRRGIWRDKRGELQPNADQEGLTEYEDVDLNSPYGPRSNSYARPAHSTLQDVINSGISAFTGRPMEPPRKSSTNNASRPRKQSLGLLSEDGFDEEAFRLAQEEEAKRRIERVKDVKRALPQWKGWRLDLVDLRRGGIGSGREVGPIFEV